MSHHLPNLSLDLSWKRYLTVSDVPHVIAPDIAPLRSGFIARNHFDGVERMIHDGHTDVGSFSDILLEKRRARDEVAEIIEVAGFDGQRCTTNTIAATDRAADVSMPSRNGLTVCASAR